MANHHERIQTQGRRAQRRAPGETLTVAARCVALLYYAVRLVLEFWS